MTSAFEPMTTAEPGPPAVRRRRVWPRFAIAFVLGLIAVLGIGVGALSAYDDQYHDRILPGVRVGTVNVGGLTAADAAARLHEAYDSLGTGRVVLAAGGKEIVLSFARTQRGADVDGMVARALSVGRAGNAVERAIANARTAIRGVDIPAAVRYDQRSLTRWVNALAMGENVAPSDAVVTRTLEGYTITPSIVGRRADPTTALASLTTALGALDAPAEIRVEVPFVELPPELTTEEATEAVATANRIAADLRVTDGDESWTIKAPTIRTWLLFRTDETGLYRPEVVPARVEKGLKTVAKGVAREARNASFKISGTRVVGVIKSVNGRALDAKRTAAEIVETLSARATGGPSKSVAAVLTSTAPALTTAEAKAAAPKMREISRWTTYFPITEKNGFGANIWIPALDIDGYVVGPRQTFDFWNAVGPVTRARGYRDGGAIINGKTEPQGALAGGICSCSTTLFNAALRAGFEMGARRNHYYYIDRYPIGLDATVFKSSGGSVQTMSWTNDTDYPVLIRGYRIRDGGRGYVRFVLYSVPTGRRVSFSNPVIKNRRAPRDTVQYTSSMPAGTSRRVEYPVEGKDVWVTRTVRDRKGNIVHRETYYSHYAVITGLTLIGTAGAAADTTSP
jgi:vancomycin resistance protein YoaR